MLVVGGVSGFVCSHALCLVGTGVIVTLNFVPHG